MRVRVWVDRNGQVILEFRQEGQSVSVFNLTKEGARELAVELSKATGGIVPATELPS